MFKYREIKREKYFNNDYPYKVYFNFNVFWSKEKTTWFNEEHKSEMNEIIKELNKRYPKMFKVQGAVIYCRDLDVAFYLKLIYNDKIKLIEKAIIENDNDQSEKNEEE